MFYISHFILFCAPLSILFPLIATRVLCCAYYAGANAYLVANQQVVMALELNAMEEWPTPVEVHTLSYEYY